MMGESNAEARCINSLWISTNDGVGGLISSLAVSRVDGGTVSVLFALLIGVHVCHLPALLLTIHFPEVRRHL
jgi:hypothetical protein